MQRKRFGTTLINQPQFWGRSIWKVLQVYIPKAFFVFFESPFL